MEQKSSAAMLAIKRSAGGTPKVNLRNRLHAGEEAHKQGIGPDFETQDRCHQKSKTGLMSLKISSRCLLHDAYENPCGHNALDLKT